jgi:endonuclease V-like protein UPF0215 family
MNRFENKNAATDAARLFEEEVRELIPDIPQDELCAMVDEYIYYQTNGLSKREADSIVETTCFRKQA